MPTPAVIYMMINCGNDIIDNFENWRSNIERLLVQHIIFDYFRKRDRQADFLLLFNIFDYVF